MTEQLTKLKEKQMNGTSLEASITWHAIAPRIQKMKRKFKSNQSERLKTQTSANLI